jgi:hypothetical protein
MPTSYWKGLGASARLHWQYFVFAWMFPVFVYATFVVMSSLGVVSARASVWFLLMVVAVLLLFGWIAITPCRRRSVTAVQAAIWIIVVPILIFCALDSLPFKWPLTMELPTSSNSRLERWSGRLEILVWMHPVPRAFGENTGSIVRTARRASLPRMHSLGRLGFGTARHWCSTAFGAPAAGGTLPCAIRRT